MERVSQVDIRKSLEVVDLLTKAGAGFVPIPYSNDEEKCALITVLTSKLNEMMEDCGVSTDQE